MHDCLQFLKRYLAVISVKYFKDAPNPGEYTRNETKTRGSEAESGQWNQGLNGEGSWVTECIAGVVWA